MHSLSRFFYGVKKTLPSRIAGRFYPQTPGYFKLKSQNLSIDCKNLGITLQASPGSWISVHVVSCINNVYQVTEHQELSSCKQGQKELGFSYKNKGQTLQDWSRFLDAIKEFFHSRACAYASSPSIVLCPGTEPQINFFKTSFLQGKKQKNMYLSSSPEMHLKKLLCQDWTDFFEIKTCYRNEEASSTHQAEFTLLEWYRAFYSTTDLIQEVCDLLKFLQTKDFCKTRLSKFKTYTVRELFKKYLNFSLKPNSSAKDLMQVLKQTNNVFCEQTSFEDCFWLLFLNEIEPKIPKDQGSFIKDYPWQLRAFAKLNSQAWADRFELYWQGLELANAFYEVTDPKEQLRLFKKDLAQRQDGVTLDKELLHLMENQAMPPCSGIALGLDRLFLALYKKTDLSQTRLFSIQDI